MMQILQIVGFTGVEQGGGARTCVNQLGFAAWRASSGRWDSEAKGLVCRQAQVFGIDENTVTEWEERFAEQNAPLMLFAVCHEFISLIVLESSSWSPEVVIPVPYEISVKKAPVTYEDLGLRSSTC